MKLNEKQYNITLSEDDIRGIVTALHNEYLDKRDQYRENKDADAAPGLYKLMATAQEARNFFAGLVNISYMGQDF